jgi:hypothetical protein
MEGSGGIWERLHYDRSDPNRVVLTTADSNETNVATSLRFSRPSLSFRAESR